MTLDVLIDEYTHAWNNGAGRRGLFLDADSAGDHLHLARIAIKEGTAGLSLRDNVYFHELELRNYLQSGSPIPDFFNAVNPADLRGFARLP